MCVQASPWLSEPFWVVVGEQEVRGRQRLKPASWPGKQIAFNNRALLNTLKLGTHDFYSPRVHSLHLRRPHKRINLFTRLGKIPHHLGGLCSLLRRGGRPRERLGLRRGRTDGGPELAEEFVGCGLAGRHLAEERFRNLAYEVRLVDQFSLEMPGCMRCVDKLRHDLLFFVFTSIRAATFWVIERRATSLDVCSICN
jgi:hypothetical protein